MSKKTEAYAASHNHESFKAHPSEMRLSIADATARAEGVVLITEQLERVSDSLERLATCGEAVLAFVNALKGQIPEFLAASMGGARRGIDLGAGRPIPSDD